MLKGYDFTFRPEPVDFIPDPDFVPFAWNPKDKDDGADKGMGGDVGGGHDPSGCPPAHVSDGDTEMPNASTSGSAGNNALMNSV